MEKLIEKIKSKLFVDEDSPEFFDSKYRVFELKKEDFKEIKKTEKKKLIFIDGGSQELFKAPNISLFFNRIYYCIYEDNKRIKSKKYEFYSLIYTEQKEKELFYNTEILFTKDSFEVPKLEFSAKDKTLMFGKNIVDISDIGNNIRRLLELKVASLIEEDNAIIVLDRNLEAKITFEEEFLKEVYENAKKRKNIVCGLAKTSSLLTKKGNSVNALLNSLGPDKEWFYKVAEIDTFDIYFVKLNSEANYIFRLDIQKEPEIIFYNFKLNASDPVFLGYPYGLIEADTNARVNNKEIEFLKIQLIVKFGKDFKRFKKYLQTQDAHSILDNIG